MYILLIALVFLCASYKCDEPSCDEYANYSGYGGWEKIDQKEKEDVNMVKGMVAKMIEKYNIENPGTDKYIDKAWTQFQLLDSYYQLVNGYNYCLSFKIKAKTNCNSQANNCIKEHQCTGKGFQSFNGPPKPKSIVCKST